MINCTSSLQRISQTLFCNFRREGGKKKKKRRKLHIEVFENWNLGKENKGKLYERISTVLSMSGTFFISIACMFRGHHSQNKTFKSCSYLNSTGVYELNVLVQGQQSSVICVLISFMYTRKSLFLL